MAMSAKVENPVESRIVDLDPSGDRWDLPFDTHRCVTECLTHATDNITVLVKSINRSKDLHTMKRQKQIAILSNEDGPRK